MADTKITALTAITTVDPAADVLPIVDVSDTSMAASGTTKKITSNQILGSGGTATLASATITGDLTVRTNQLVVNSTGVGVGSTPSAWSGIGPALQVEQASLLSEASNQLYLTANGYFAGGQWNYINTASADQYYQIAGSHVWRSANSGTAGTAIGWSTLMTLNASGLGVGGSPTSKLSIFAGADGDVGFFRGGSTRQLQIGTSATAGYLNADNGSAGFELRVNGTARAYFDTSGNVGIGVTPSAWGNAYKVVQTGQALGVYGRANLGYYGTKFNLYNDNTNDIAISTNFVGEYRFELLNGSHVWLNKPTAGSVGVAQTLTQAMTLDGSGNLLVGTTSAGGNRLNVQTASGDCTALIKSQAANVGVTIDYVSNYGNFNFSKSGTAKWSLGILNDSASTPTFKLFNDAAVGVYVTYGGTSWTATSDERLKDIIEPISNAVAKVGSLRSVIGKFKSDDTNTRRSFLIAQDVQAVLPEAVDASNPDKLGVAYSEVIPLLVAAIKELTARVQTLETR